MWSSWRRRKPPSRWAEITAKWSKNERNVRVTRCSQHAKCNCYVGPVRKQRENSNARWCRYVEPASEKEAAEDFRCVHVSAPCTYSCRRTSCGCCFNIRATRGRSAKAPRCRVDAGGWSPRRTHSWRISLEDPIHNVSITRVNLTKTTSN